MGFCEVDKVGIFQPNDDTLVVTLRIKGFDVKRVMVYQGSKAKVMYLDLYKRLRLKPYDIPLVGFDGKTIEVDFIVLNAYSPYIAILARPCLHVMGVVSYTLHVKVKYPTEGHVGELLGCQIVARQFMVIAVRH